MKTKIKSKKLYPWKFTLLDIKTRCNNINYKQWNDYGGRGIECKITVEELEFLWYRDKAYLMKKPSIDRKDNDGNYELSNCQYIELSENIAKRNKEKSSIAIIQYDLNGNFIKEWYSIRDSERELNIDHSSISRCCKNKQYTAGGFRWRYKL